MYTIAKRFAFSAAHVIGGLPANHPCARLHGHNYEVEVVLQSSTSMPWLRARLLRAFGAADFINATLDHKHLNDVLGHDRTTTESSASGSTIGASALAGSGRRACRRAPRAGRIQAMKRNPHQRNLWPTIQGEGRSSAAPPCSCAPAAATIAAPGAIRSMRCSPNIATRWAAMTPGEIMARVDELAGGTPAFVSLSGAIRPCSRSRR